MDALITEIQRFSLNDGPGIRTTVFFQGCNMCCAWCHNPETECGHPVLMYYANKCIGCGRCFNVCPEGAHRIENGEHVIDRNLCINCGRCASGCFPSALVMSSRPYTVDEAMSELIQDKLYYRESGGGVTLSGGEATLHTEFAAELARACRAEGIHVAVETNLYADFDYMKPLLETVDMAMCDIKIFDSDIHKKWVGVPNEPVLDNIMKLDVMGIPIIVRTPLIPGVTDSAENINGIAEYIGKMRNIVRYELLNFNPLGDGKYAALGMENVFAECRPFGIKELEALRSKLNTKGIELKIS